MAGLPGIILLKAADSKILKVTFKITLLYFSDWS